MKNENLVNIIIFIIGVIGALFSNWLVVKNEISVINVEIKNLNEKIIILENTKHQNLEAIKNLSFEIVRLKTILEQEKK